MADTYKFVAGQDYYLSGNGIAASDTSITLKSFKFPNSGDTITMTDFGSIGYGTLEPGTARREFISWTGVTQNGDGSATLTGVTRGLDAAAPYTSVAGLKKGHAGNSLFRVTNAPQLYNKLAAKDNDETITETWTFTTPNFPRMNDTTAPTDDEQLATKKYADDLAIAGAPDATNAVKGIVEIATLAETKAGSTTGGTSATTVPTSATVAGAVQDSSWVYAADAEASDTYAITLTPAPTAYATGQKFIFKANTANTGAATLNVNALGAKTIKKFHDQDLEDGDIESGSIVEVVYDGTNFQMTSAVASGLLQSNITNTEAATLTGGGDASSLHTHKYVDVIKQTLGVDDMLEILLDSNDRTFFTESGGTINELNIVTNIQSGAVSGNSAVIYSNNVLAGFPLFSNNWDKNSFFSAHINLGSATLQDVFFGLGSGVTVSGANATNTTRHAGFWVEDATIYASNADGTTQTRTDVSAGITVTENNTYQIEITGGSSIKFYINGTLVATHTTNLPTGSSTNFDLFFGIATATGEGRSLNVYRKIRLFLERN